MSGTVLAAVDLAHVGNRSAIVAKAAQLAEIEGARLAVVTVIPDYGMSIVGTYFDKDAEHLAMTHASDKLHDVVSSTLGKDPKVKHIVAHGTAYEEILHAATDLEANLIVMGAHKPEFRDYLIGPNAARVVRHSKCSVYVLRES